MRRHKITTIIVLLLIATILSGCSSTSKKDPITDTNVYKGTEGIEIEFLKDSPPQEMYEGESFQVLANLINKGAYPINYGRIVLTHEPDYIDVATTYFTFNLKGKDIYDPQDKEVLKSFFLTSRPLESKSIGHESIVLITACYDYGTKLNAEACIDTDPHNQRVVEKPCTAQELSFSGQGAPVAVTRIEQKMLISEGNKIRPQFQIHISNLGGGQVISKYNIDKACGSTGMSANELNGVILKDLKFSQYSLSDMDCQPNPTNQPNPVLKLINGEDYFVCTLKEEKAISNDNSIFKTNLYVELEYGYTSTASKEFMIKKVNT